MGGINILLLLSFSTCRSSPWVSANVATQKISTCMMTFHLKRYWFENWLLGIGHFTLARLRAQLRQSWAEAEHSQSWAFSVNKVQLRFSVYAYFIGTLVLKVSQILSDPLWHELQDVHTSGFSEARLRIRVEPIKASVKCPIFKYEYSFHS